MSEVKKIALVTSASNFERHKHIVKSVHEKLKKLGNYALYVITSYGLYVDKDDIYEKGEASIYTLLREGDFDGCILEGNIANQVMLYQFAEILQIRKIPFVTLSFGMEEHPFFIIDGYKACCNLMDHLIKEHHCTRINMAQIIYEDIYCMQAIQAYKDSLEKYGIPVEEDRIVKMPVSIKNGRSLYQIFKERNIDDAEAVLCMHDVFAIGLCLEMQERGVRVPEDLKVCSMARSTNSIIFKPDITGAGTAEKEMSEKACECLVRLMEGEEVPIENYISGEIEYGESCGCLHKQENPEYERFQELILNKIETGNQVSRMMQFNDSLEEVDSIDKLGKIVKKMLKGIDCDEFILCLNQQTMKYIADEETTITFENSSFFDNIMIAVTGSSNRTGEIIDRPFSVKNLLPIAVQAGDILIFLPVHHKEQVYGYIVFVNEYMPIDTYNYRICHESLGSSMENLHRQMILRKSIKELDELHMRDALTGLHNRFAWNRFSGKYVERGEYCVVMLDMDYLKVINDTFGHLAGNNAINITANAIASSVQKNDLVIRCGGDEFMILSHTVDEMYWKNLSEQINQKMAEQVKRQKLPYELGISVGFCICDGTHPITFETCCEKADKAMYENKSQRHALRN